VVATDLDGTLLRSDGSISDRTRIAIADAEEAGVPTIFVTARPPRWLDELADVVGEHGVAICGNGAFVYDVATRTVASCRGFDPEVMAAVVADLRAEFPGITFAAERPDGMGREPAFVDPYSHEYVVEDDPHSSVSPVGKLLARWPDADPHAFLQRVEDVVGGRVEIGYSGAVGLAEMTASGVTKASGLAAWCEEHGIDASEVWACGDMPNDLPMLAWAGRGLAVRNAHPDVIAAAAEVIASNDEDGVADVLESIVRQGAP